MTKTADAAEKVWRDLKRCFCWVSKIVSVYSIVTLYFNVRKRKIANSVLNTDFMCEKINLLLIQEL